MVPLKQLIHIVETFISQTALSKKLKIEDTHVIQNHSDHQTQHVNNKASTTKGHPGQITGLHHFSM